MRRRFALSGAALATAWSLATADARAQLAELEWDAPSTCPTRDRVAAEIGELTQRSPADARVRATITEGAVWSAQIVIERGDEHGERRLEAPTCEALAHAVALVVALSLDRPGSLPAPPPPPPTPPPPSPPTPPDEGVAAPAAPSGRSARVGLVVSVGAAGSAGLLPSATPGAEAGATLAIGRVELGADGAYFARVSASAEATTATGSFALVSAAAHGAYAIEAAQDVRVAPLLGLELAWVTGEARGAATSQSQTELLAVPFAGAEVRFRLGDPFELVVGADVGAPVTSRARFVIDNAGLVHRPAAVRGRGGVGVRVLLF